MKDGKPEVLIIGEHHPQGLVMSKLPLKQVKVKLGKNYLTDGATIDLEKAGPHRVIEVARVASAIIDAEVKLITDFGAKRLLLEHPLIPITKRAARHLQKTHDLAKFQEDMKLLDAKIAKDQQAHLKKLDRQLQDKVPLLGPFLVHPNYKWISFFIARTGISDINFFDDYETTLNERSYYHFINFFEQWPEMGLMYPSAKPFFLKLLAANNSQREAKMIKNIKRNLVDKTVVICGEFHMRSIFAGLKKVAHLEPSAYFKFS